MRSSIKFALMAVVAMVATTAIAATTLINVSTPYYYTGPDNDESEFFEASNWKDDVPDACGGSADVPCHLDANDEIDLAGILLGFNEDVEQLVLQAGKRSH